MSKRDGKEDLYRRLEQTRRVLRQVLDPLTRERLEGLANSIEQQLAGAEAKDSDAPPE
jgi:DNA-binding TFAR19-related protein (PDSD5 family)